MSDKGQAVNWAQFTDRNTRLAPNSGAIPVVMEEAGRKLWLRTVNGEKYLVVEDASLRQIGSIPLHNLSAVSFK